VSLKGSITLGESAEHLVLHAQLANLAAIEELVRVVHIEAGVVANAFVFEHFAEHVEVVLLVQHEVVRTAARDLVDLVGVQQLLVEINALWGVVQAVARLEQVVLVVAHDHRVRAAADLLDEDGVLVQRVLRERLREFEFFWRRLRLNQVHSNRISNTELASIIHAPGVDRAVFQDAGSEVICSVHLLESKAAWLCLFLVFHLELELFVQVRS